MAHAYWTAAIRNDGDTRKAPCSAISSRVQDICSVLLCRADWEGVGKGLFRYWAGDGCMAWGDGWGMHRGKPPNAAI